ncbi:MAG TPA: peptide chain release factor N(5)-glutamine methyltransferase [Mycobacteriales bacterium]|nr:peptide chain release factor N(5)-glutamine methyltransferase [Mycobacteriales bacterium]
MNPRAALAWATEVLAAAGVASPEHDARVLAQHVLGVRRMSDVLLAEQLPEEAFRALITRRAAREPLQHLVGSVGFRWIELEVGPGVFVPRPETELVVQAVLEELGEARDALVVDLCTGSGVIPLSLAHEAPGTVLHAVEIDPGALEWARRNDPDGTVTWHLGPVEGCLPELDGQVDVVVSNPPYVPLGSEIQREAGEHDPPVALWAGVDGLDVVRDVEAAARRLLKPGGLVVVEHDDTQGESAPEVFSGWAEVEDHADLTGRPRYVTARWTG